jgi:hypothetical protein
MKLLTRQQIIDIWNNQPKKFKEKYCCPNCRNVLHITTDNMLYCNNSFCSNLVII